MNDQKLPDVAYMAFPLRITRSGAATSTRVAHIREQIEQNPVHHARRARVSPRIRRRRPAPRVRTERQVAGCASDPASAKCRPGGPAGRSRPEDAAGPRRRRPGRARAPHRGDRLHAGRHRLPRVVSRDGGSGVMEAS